MPESREPTEWTTDVVWDRVAAGVVDFGVQFGQMVVVALVLSSLLPPGAGTVEGYVALGFLTVPLYGTVLEGFFDGRTLGKWFTGLAVVDHRGASPSLLQALVRNVPALVVFSWVPAAVALVSIASTEYNQRLFDRVADTYVVRA